MQPKAPLYTQNLQLVQSLLWFCKKIYSNFLSVPGVYEFAYESAQTIYTIAKVKSSNGQGNRD